MGRALSVVVVVVLSMGAGLALMAFAPSLLNGGATPSGPIVGTEPAVLAASIPVAGPSQAAAPDEQEELSPRELEKRIGEVLDDLGGHPDDPALRALGLIGASDEVVASMDPMEVKLLLQDQDVIGFLSRHEDEPRYTFALGRLAMFHGYTTMAEKLLRVAMDKGSGPAAAYLADPLFTPDDIAANSLFLKAESLGFKPAAQWRADLVMQEEPQLAAGGGGVAFRFEDFDRPELIRAFYEGRSPSGLQELESWAYINSFLLAIEDTNNLFMVEDPRAYYMELSPSTKVHAEIAMATSSKVLDESMGVGLQQIMGMLGGMQGMQNGNGSLTGAVTQMNKNMLAPVQGLMYMKASGEHDGRRLALGYDNYREEFRKVYAGVKKYVESKR